MRVVPSVGPDFLHGIVDAAIPGAQAEGQVLRCDLVPSPSTALGPDRGEPAMPIPCKQNGTRLVM